jgi:hypothetical protein
VSVLPSTAAGRISLAIGLSLLLHAVMLIAPMIELPKYEVALPPLTAKLEPLPAPVARPDQPKAAKPKTRPARIAKDTAPPSETKPEPEPIEPEPPATSKAPEETRPAHPLPKHAQLTFTAYRGNGGMRLGEAVHRLDIEEGRYTLKALTRTTGLASIFKLYESTQQSDGTVARQGLRPVKYSETKNTSKGKEVIEAEFPHEHESPPSSSADPETPVSAQTQDIISFLYQLSQLSLDRGVIPIFIHNGKKLEHYELAVGEEEEIETPLGKLRTLPLRKIHAQGEEGLDVWLGLEYRLLPVKIRQIDRDGQIAGEMVVSDIRVADE